MGCEGRWKVEGEVILRRHGFSGFGFGGSWDGHHINLYE